MTIFLHFALKRPTNDQKSGKNMKYYIIQHIFFTGFHGGRRTIYSGGPGAPLKKVLFNPKNVLFYTFNGENVCIDHIVIFLLDFIVNDLCE